MGWIAAPASSPAPNLTTKLVARTRRAGQGAETFDAGEGDQPDRRAPGCSTSARTSSGWPELHVPNGLPAGTVIKMLPGETLNADGTVNQASIGVGGRGSTCSTPTPTLGDARARRWQPKFNYFAHAVGAGDRPARRATRPTTDTDHAACRCSRTPRAPATSRPTTRASTACTTWPCTRSQSNMMSVVHRLPGAREAVLRRPTTPADGLAQRQLRLRRLPAQHGGPPRRGPVQAGHPRPATSRSRRRSTTGATPASSATRSTGAPRSCWCRALLYKLYGDTQTMREHCDAMKTYMDFVARAEGRHRRGRVHRHRAAGRLGVRRADLAADDRHLGLLHRRQEHGRRWRR